MLEKSLKANETVFAVFLDIEDAFDKVSMDSMLKALADRGADEVTQG